ncbi:unnamed protein product, partial [Schistosoma margrebowiei]
IRQLYDRTKKLTGKHSKPERPVKDKEGRPITEIQQQRHRRVEYFEELLNSPAPTNPPDIKASHTNLPIDVNPPTKEEIRMAIRQIKSGKATGPYNMPAEALKLDIKVTTKMLHLLFKKIWEEEQVPMDYNEEHFVKIPKKGDLSKCENYRGKERAAFLQLKNIWNSKQLSTNIRVRIFNTNVKAVLLYGAET